MRGRITLARPLRNLMAEPIAVVLERAQTVLDTLAPTVLQPAARNRSGRAALRQ
jgi:hypothetical protein